MSDNASGSQESGKKIVLTKDQLPADPKQGPVRPNLWLYWILYGGCLIAYALLLLYGKSQWHTILFEVGGLKFNLGTPILAIPIVHLCLSLKKVDTDVVAGKYFYGTPLFKAHAGLNFVPRGIMNIIDYPADINEIYMPAKPDEVFWGDEKEPLPPGMVRPIWVPTRAPTDVELEPMDAQMVVGVNGYEFWRVKDVFTFHARIRSIPEADSQQRSIWLRVASEEIVGYTASGAIANQGNINSLFDDNIQRYAADWGIEVTSAGLTKINVSHDLGASMRNRAKARFDAETRVIEGTSQAEVIERMGVAEGKASRARASGPLIGRAEGMAAMAKVLQVQGGEILAAETMRDALENANVVYAGAEGGMRDIFAGADAIKQILTSKGGKDVKPAADA